jgi:hypothetical protein
MPRLAIVLLPLLGTSVSAWSQGDLSTKPATISATVADSSGARIAAANVHIGQIGGTVERDLTTDSEGRFVVSGLPAGRYNVVVQAAGFDTYLKEVRLSAGGNIILSAALTISTNQTTITVTDDSNALSTASDANKDALVFNQEQLRNLSDDDATFQQQLQAIAGGDGSHPPQVYVDGFSGGQFPPKSAIRQIRINQNPFSAAYDSLGFGRIEISTKPGTGAVHGQLEVFGNPSGLNSQNPFIHFPEPGYYRVHTRGNISGPLDKKSSFFVSADFYNQQNNAIINAQTVAGNSNAIITVNSAVPNPQTTQNYSARYDRQWSTNNVLTARYEFDRIGQDNAGIGLSGGNFGQGISCPGSSTPYTLASQGVNCTGAQHTLQLGNSQILGANAALDTHFQWIHIRQTQDPVSNAPTVLVNGTVNDGGSATQTTHDSTDQFEFQESGTYEGKRHYIRAGVRARIYRDTNLSTSNRNGTFTFNSLTDYQASVAPDGGTSATPLAAQFSITTGQSTFHVSTADVALYAEDEIKLTKSLTGTLGVRFETQTAIPDHFDPSPHFGLAWSPRGTDKKPAPVVYRIGTGIFYDRLPIATLLSATRQNNPALQTTYIVTSARASDPTAAGVPFFSRTAAGLPPVGQLGISSPATVYRVAPDYRSPYEIDSGASAEIALGKRGSISFNYLNFRGVHQLVSRNANAPLPDGTRPMGNAAGNVYEYSTRADTIGHFIFTHPQITIAKGVQFWAFAMIQRFSGDTMGSSSFASNSYNIHQDWGRSPWDRHQAIFTGVDADWKYGLHAGVFLAARGGQPFNITTGSDLNKDTIFNDRPSFATADDIANDPANTRSTPFGTFHIAPSAGEKPVPINYGHSPKFVSLQLQLQETVQFGPRKADPDAPPPPPAEAGKPAPRPDPRYALVFSLEVQNLTNTVSPATRIGTLTSPYFGQSINSANSFLSTSAANRTLQLHTAFRF